MTVHVERRAVCSTCGTLFESRTIPSHYVPGSDATCGRVERDARQTVVVFRLDSVEVGVVRDGEPLGYVADLLGERS